MPSRPGGGLDYKTTYQYDALGRPTTTTLQDGAISSTSYSGNKTTERDPAGQERQSWADALGRLTQVTEDPSGKNYTTTYTYDVLDDLKSVNQGGRTRSFNYDSLGRLSNSTSPESGVITYTYYPNGNLDTRADGRGVQTNYYYDTLNRLTKKTYADGVTSTVTYAYDTATNGKGYLRSITNGNSVTNYTSFDALGDVTASSQQTWGQTYNFSYVYNLAGALTSETYPSGRVVTTAYNTVNQESGVTGTFGAQPTNYVGTVSYWPHGGEEKYWLANQIVKTYFFYAAIADRGRLGCAVRQSKLLFLYREPDYVQHIGERVERQRERAIDFAMGGAEFSAEFCLRRAEPADECERFRRVVARVRVRPMGKHVGELERKSAAGRQHADFVRCV